MSCFHTATHDKAKLTSLSLSRCVLSRARMLSPSLARSRPLPPYTLRTGRPSDRRCVAPTGWAASRRARGRPPPCPHRHPAGRGTRAAAAKGEEDDHRAAATSTATAAVAARRCRSGRSSPLDVDVFDRNPPVLLHRPCCACSGTARWPLRGALGFLSNTRTFLSQRFRSIPSALGLAAMIPNE